MCVCVHVCVHLMREGAGGVHNGAGTLRALAHAYTHIYRHISISLSAHHSCSGGSADATGVVMERGLLDGRHS